ncbi:hypothetical protein K470DRAFT_296267 [Piedraia hortae CBS 480.64]|uniref:WD40 repeat-like protein n=1 Tax=Piedraia hortae CBS 480.64 TaxID=1314780 RepID=A0A6A7BTG3_9PEZI|nr:hypothetical protein K470DRAFT_296267 [Piedraia hortae CBS 480.64]
MDYMGDGDSVSRSDSSAAVREVWIWGRKDDGNNKGPRREQARYKGVENEAITKKKWQWKDPELRPVSPPLEESEEFVPPLSKPKWTWKIDNDKLSQNAPTFNSNPNGMVQDGSMPLADNKVENRPPANTPRAIVQRDASYGSNLHRSDNVVSKWSGIKELGHPRPASERVPSVMSVPVLATTTDMPIQHARLSSVQHLDSFTTMYDPINRNQITAGNISIVYCRPSSYLDSCLLQVFNRVTKRYEKLFRNVPERIIDLQCFSPSSNVDVVLGVGIQGTVFLAKVQPNMQAEALSMKPGGQIKSKLSNHHDCFAICRADGTVYVVSVQILMQSNHFNPASCVVDTPAFLAEKNSNIGIIRTGSTCSDVCFSADDTMLATADDTNIVKFWDVHHHAPGPIAAYCCGHSSFVSASTVLLFDRPGARAQRFMLHATDRNHVLRLVDLASGLIVHEIRVPRGPGTGFCSLSYSAHLETIVLGHPERNSVFFFQLTLPQYNLPPSMSQSRFISLRAEGVLHDLFPQHGRLTVTAWREVSLRYVGQIRSVSLTPHTSIGLEVAIYLAAGCALWTVALSDIGLSTRKEPVNVPRISYQALLKRKAFIDSLLSTTKEREREPKVNILSALPDQMKRELLPEFERMLKAETGNIIAALEKREAELARVGADNLATLQSIYNAISPIIPQTTQSALPPAVKSEPDPKPLTSAQQKISNLLTEGNYQAAGAHIAKSTKSDQRESLSVFANAVMKTPARLKELTPLLHLALIVICTNFLLEMDTNIESMLGFLDVGLRHLDVKGDDVKGMIPTILTTLESNLTVRQDVETKKKHWTLVGKILKLKGLMGEMKEV